MLFHSVSLAKHVLITHAKLLHFHLHSFSSHNHIGNVNSENDDDGTHCVKRHTEDIVLYLGVTRFNRKQIAMADSQKTNNDNTEFVLNTETRNLCWEYITETKSLCE